MADTDTKAFEEDTYQLEAETRQKVSSAMSTIEVAISEYESVKKKTPELDKRVLFLRMTYDLLIRWEKDSLMGKKDLRSSIIRLKSFSKICQMLSDSKELN